jgi:hypothetical protein
LRLVSNLSFILSWSLRFADFEGLPYQYDNNQSETTSCSTIRKVENEVTREINAHREINAQFDWIYTSTG